jgi:hypothetical protein
MLPADLSDILQCPTPFIVGMYRTEDVERTLIPSDVVVVDMDNGSVRVPSQLLRPFRAGKLLVKLCENILRPDLVQCDSAKVPASASAHGSDAARSASPPCNAHLEALFHHFVAESIRHAAHYCVRVSVPGEHILMIDDSIVRAVHDEPGASAAASLIPRKCSEYFTRLFSSQAFSAFLCGKSDLAAR